MNPFVIQRHRTAGGVHFDLMLDRGDGGPLATWSLTEMPRPDGGPVPARQLAAHRRAYLTYEGPVGGDRGEVRIVAAGRYEELCGEADRIVLRLQAEGLSGRYVLRRDASGGPDAWRLVPEGGGFPKESD
jgi:hypothetical protein